MNLENGLQFLRLLHAILDIRSRNYELKIIEVLRAILYQRPNHKALTTHIWVATHGLRNVGSGYHKVVQLISFCIK